MKSRELKHKGLGKFHYFNSRPNHHLHQGAQGRKEAQVFRKKHSRNAT